VSDPYAGREQTKAKHFILRHYLQALAFKVLTFSDITYVDGFSGPWETRTENFSDSSFMIAISVLKDAQQRMLSREFKRRIRCFLIEKEPTAFAQLQAAVLPLNRPDEGFEIKTYCGEFEDAVAEIQQFVANSFALIFIDPTGWKGYPLDKIKPMFRPRKCEVLLNFMYDHINRFARSEDEPTIQSLSPILGGPDWRDRLDTTLRRGLAVEKLFRETLKVAGDFNYVVSTKIDKATADRPHFFIIYGTKSPDGLKAFRQIEYDALREHARGRAVARERRREAQTKTADMFASYESDMQEATVDELVDEQKEAASADLLAALQRSDPVLFSTIVAAILEAYMLRETNVKDMCVALAKAGKIENTWGGGNRKPRDNDLITLVTNTA
jgi:three-Cys-motif partner protein